MLSFAEMFCILLHVYCFFGTGRSDCFLGNANSDQETEKKIAEEANCIVSTANNNNMVLIKGGSYEIGTDDPVFVADGEAPARQVYLEDFFIDVHEVSNQEFANFVKHTNYVTEAEKFGSSFVFEGIVDEKLKSEIQKVVAAAPWWLPVVNASWNHPEGPITSISGLSLLYCCIVSVITI